MEPDEGAAADAIKRRLGRETGATTDGLKFAELHRRLSQQPGLRNRWALLHVLQQVAEDRKAEDSSRGGAGASAAALLIHPLSSAATAGG